MNENIMDGAREHCSVSKWWRDGGGGCDERGWACLEIRDPHCWSPIRPRSAPAPLFLVIFAISVGHRHIVLGRLLVIPDATLLFLLEAVLDVDENA